MNLTGEATLYGLFPVSPCSGGEEAAGSPPDHHGCFSMCGQRHCHGNHNRTVAFAHLPSAGQSAQEKNVGASDNFFCHAVCHRLDRICLFLSSMETDQQADSYSRQAMKRRVPIIWNMY